MKKEQIIKNNSTAVMNFEQKSEHLNNNLSEKISNESSVENKYFHLPPPKIL